MDCEEWYAFEEECTLPPWPISCDSLEGPVYECVARVEFDGRRCGRYRAEIMDCYDEHMLY